MTSTVSRLEVPLIDISPLFAGRSKARQRVAAAIGTACEQQTLFSVTGHRIPSDLLIEVADLSRQFFDLPVSEKLEVRARRGAGYRPIPAQNLHVQTSDDEAEDLKESFNAVMDVARNRWPRRPVGLELAFVRFIEQCEILSVTLMRTIALALGEAEDAFDTRLGRDTISLLRAINYPAQTPDLKPGTYRCMPHTDYGPVSILLSENRPGGLQVRIGDGDWLDAPTPEGTLLVNIGDVMERWSAGRFRATVHRVINPPPGAGLISRRQTIVYFYNPTEIRPQVEAYLDSQNA